MAELSRAQWEDIREQYEAGASQASLAKEHTVSQQAISKRAKREHWVHGQAVVTPLQPTTPFPPPGDVESIANLGIAGLGRHLATELPLREHMLLSQSLTQYVKAKTLAPQEAPEQEDGLFIPLGRISPETRMEIRRLLALDAQEREQVR